MINSADDAYKATLGMQAELIAQATELAPHADAMMSTPEGRRRATRLLTERYEHLPADLLAHQLRGIANAPAAVRLVEHGLREGFAPLDAEKVTCPVRIVWGSEDKLLPWPSAARGTATTGSLTPTGSSSTASGTAPSSTSRWRRRS